VPFVCDDVESRRPVDQVLCQARNRDALVGEALGDVREGAGAVGDLDPDVVGSRQVSRRQLLERAPAGVALEEPGSSRPEHADQVGDDGGRRLDPAGTRAFEHQLTDRVPLQHDGVERAHDRGERMLQGDECGADAHVHGVVQERRSADEADDRAQRAGRLDVLRTETLYSFVRDIVDEHPRAERDRGEDRHLGGGVGAVHVLGGVGLGVPEPLRLCERILVGGAALHPRQDEVRRAIDDPEHPVNVRGDE